jgi:hypothetical protein
MAHPDTLPISTYPPVASMWIVALHNLFLYSDPPLPCHPPSYWLRLFSSQTLSRINNQHFSNLVTLHTYLPMKMGQSVPKRRHIKFKTPGNYPEESTQQINLLPYTPANYMGWIRSILIVPTPTFHLVICVQ